MTDTLSIPDGSFGLDDEQCRDAALVLAGRANDADDLRSLLECCGLIPYQSTPPPTYQFGRRVDGGDR